MAKTGLITILLIALLAFIGGCMPTEAPDGESGTSILPLIIFLVLIFGLFYFVMVRPQRRRQKAHETMMQDLQKVLGIVMEREVAYQRLWSHEKHHPSSCRITEGLESSL